MSSSSNWRLRASPERDYELVPAVVDPKEDRSFGFKGKRPYRGKKYSSKGSRGRNRGRGRGQGRGRGRGRGRGFKSSGRGKTRRRVNNISGKPERVRPSVSAAPTSTSEPPKDEAPVALPPAVQTVPESEEIPVEEAKESEYDTDDTYYKDQYYPQQSGYEYIDPQYPRPYIRPEVTEQMVKEQMNYYFSVENLCKDVFLRQHMDVEGYVPLSIVAQFQRMQQITNDLELLRQISRNSDTLTFDVANDTVRLKEDWKKWLWPTAEGVMGVPLWTKVSDEVMMEMLPTAVNMDEAETEPPTAAEQPHLSADSKPFIFSAAAKSFVPTV